MKMFDVEQVKALNDLERMVYEYVVKDPEKVKYMRIRELAKLVRRRTKVNSRASRAANMTAPHKGSAKPHREPIATPVKAE